MKSLTLVLCVVAASLSPGAVVTASAEGTQSAQPTLSLAKPYVTTLGDMIASCMNEYMPVVKSNDPWGVQAQVIASYDRQLNKIQVSIFGTNNSVDAARAGLEYFRTKVMPVLATFIATNYHVGLEDSDLTLVYIDRVHDFKEIVRRDGDKYVVNE